MFSDALDTYGIELTQAGYQVTDNAKNMIKAFDIFSLLASAMNANDDLQADDDQIVTDNSDAEVAEFVSYDDDECEDSTFDIPAVRRLPCTAHTLQLAIKDAIQQTPAIDRIIKDASAVITFFHRSLHWGCELKKNTGGDYFLCAIVHYCLLAYLNL